MDRDAARAGGLEAVRDAVAAGVDWVQVRERELSDAALLDLVREVGGAAREGARRAGRPVRVLVNRRTDVALAAEADGVHLGFDAVTPDAARSLLAEDALVGVSCHAADEVAAAGAASYAHLAPIFPPLSKASTRKPLGTRALSAAAGSRPVLAQGGVTAENAGDCVAAGAAGVAVTGSVLGAEDPAGAAAALRRALDAAQERRT